jgi:hypothetical protein
MMWWQKQLAVDIEVAAYEHGNKVEMNNLRGGGQRSTQRL